MARRYAPPRRWHWSNGVWTRPNLGRLGVTRRAEQPAGTPETTPAQPQETNAEMAKRLRDMVELRRLERHGRI